jgi:GT2 family glycosyltransferase
MSMRSIAVIVLNWNGKDSLKPCLDSLINQDEPATIYVVDNGSIDGSVAYLKQNYPKLKLLVNATNLGFAAGVNTGIRVAMNAGFDYIALLNNDAVADEKWLGCLVRTLDDHSELGIATCKLVDADNTNIDSTGDLYTIWGLPYPRGRGEQVTAKYDKETNIFAASGGASLYRTRLFEAIGLFDEDFFAYYEDVDLSFRAQLAGWKVAYVPKAIAYHQIGATSGKIRGFTTFQAIKNLPWLLVRNVPEKLLSKVLPRFLLAYVFFIMRSIPRGHSWSAAKGLYVSLVKLPKKIRERKFIQSQKTVSTEYIFKMMGHDLPPNAYNLRRLRSWWWRLKGKV